jgi:dipeptidyl aminopeptidase/acylaminoacyl peptidase
VVQGSNDKLVAQSLTDDFVLRLRKNGSLVEYLVFADEGHGLYKKANEVQVYGAVLKFLDAHLKSSATEYRYEAYNGVGTGTAGIDHGQRP